MTYTKTRLPSGIRLITVPMKGAKTITVLAAVKAGSNFETKDINGISHFLEHMMFKGTKKRPTTLQIAEELDAIGGQYNAFTSKEWTGYYAKAEARHLSFLVEILSDIFQNALLDSTEMEREKLVIIEEMNMYQDTPARHVDELAEELLYGDQPQGWKIIGEPDTLRSITRDTLMNYRKDRYVGGNTVLCIAGHIPSLNRIVNIVDEHFGQISPRASGRKKQQVFIDRQTKPAAKVQYKDTDQTHLNIAIRAYPLGSKQLPALKILNILLGGNMSSRLFINIREKEGLCYYINSHIEAYTGCGYLSLKAGVDNKRSSRAVELIIKELRALRANGVTKEEFKKARDYFEGTLALSLETSDELAFWVGGQMMQTGKIKTPEEALMEIKRVTLPDVAHVARAVLNNKRLNLTIIGPYKDARNFEKLLRI